LAPFAYGLAPVQISYLGYPGTLGTDFIDYIVADPVVIPDDKRQYYSERIIYLPNTYQPTDNTRLISDKIITREDTGLPNEGFVFCCFNASYKISRKEFDIWMRLLGKVEDSVLWLLKSNKWAEQNLKREAEARGIRAERLIFAEKVPQDEHLARQKLAGLFLDTFNYNAHTTTSDALWAGLPVVTKLGEGFATRVAGSLLTAIGLPELITESDEAYEAMALTLATNPNEIAKIKSKLEANRLTQPLFDSEMYTRHLETGYQMAYDRYFTGQARRDIVVSN
jgi:predicted O-linked N-acetylglucosamine transferase (SPINDLY family)